MGWVTGGHLIIEGLSGMPKMRIELAGVRSPQAAKACEAGCMRRAGRGWSWR
jgi:hypothetical protein